MDHGYSHQFPREFNHPDLLQIPRYPPNRYYESRISLSPSTGETPKGEKKIVDELIGILVECMGQVNTRSRESLLRKFFSEIEPDERLERFIVERLRQSKVKAIAELNEKLLPSSQRVNSYGQKDDDYYCNVSTRGLGELAEELSLKLERFKVKTPDVRVPVVEEEDKK